MFSNKRFRLRVPQCGTRHVTRLLRNRHRRRAVGDVQGVPLTVRTELQQSRVGVRWRVHSLFGPRLHLQPTREGRDT